MVFFLTFVVYRFRNNIFHGNKRVDAWLRFQPQIQDCIRVMQIMISHAAAASKELPERKAAHGA